MATANVDDRDGITDIASKTRTRQGERIVVILTMLVTPEPDDFPALLSCTPVAWSSGISGARHWNI
ncbi:MULTISPECIES: hypothetical protein [unclassified Bradyrhizobium]|uniref:hypothetical protein n=1 Tax=unclassified Bradyrhizobium TaxID=2631580 RepID=UPI0012EBCE62|nr:MULTISPECIES: hypothetical protein [unclassified Bradyrhizobium]QIG91036.1 hypothetical protein G6P99_27385 [Bradyrhizobium sp. 6(2017)]